MHVVARQADPDPDFPTVAFPNPEEPGALDLARALAVEVGADVVIANDPDADRLGVMVPGLPGESGLAGESGKPGESGTTGDGFVSLTGNQIGALLGARVLATTAGADRLVVTTFVSSRLLSRLAEAEGVHYAEVPTGFKWVVRPGLDHREQRFVFGYEEALGFSVDEAVRDKDGISAALALAELLAASKAEGRTAWDLLEALARRFGEHATRTWSWRVEGPGGLERIAGAMAELRARPPTELAGRQVVEVTDLVDGVGSLAPTDALVVGLDDGCRVCLRPSGTEPKLKVYVEVIEPVPTAPGGYLEARAAAEARIDALVAAAAALLGADAPA